MKLKQTLAAISIIVSFIGLAVLLPQTQIVSANVSDGWCEENSDISDGTGDDCLNYNYNKLTPEQQKAVGGFTGFQDKSQACMNTGSYYGMGSNDGGSCSNAVAYCYTRAMDTSGCEDNDRIGQIAKGCNQGKDTDGHGCDPVKDINKPIVDQINKDAESQLLGNCTANAGESEGDSVTRCQRTASEIVDACGGQDKQPGYEPVEGDGEYKLNDQNAYKNCLQNEAKNRATNEKECTGRSGYWIGSDTKDPDTSLPDNQRNTTKTGCYDDLTDMNNPAACAAQNDTVPGGTKWVKVGEPNHWECQSNVKNADKCKGKGGVNPDDPNKCANEAAGDPDAPLDGVNGDVSSSQTHCGEARVNLIACGDEGGATALNNILKIVVIVLTFGVGIAAVGGLAWAAVLYSKAQDNESNVQEAKTLIQEIVIGILLYVLLVAIINWLVPGTVIGT